MALTIRMLFIDGFSVKCGKISGNGFTGSKTDCLVCK